jgi:hypothetical protein
MKSKTWVIVLVVTCVVFISIISNTSRTLATPDRGSNCCHGGPPTPPPPTPPPPTPPPSVDTTPPVVTSFNIPATSTSLAVSITSLVATDDTGVTGYMVTESPAAPLFSASGWEWTPPSSYTFATSGSKTLYAWAKDGWGHVSASLGASTTIILPDTVPPTVRVFSIPATSNSLSVPITTFTADDNVGVTGYWVGESVTPPGASATGWSASLPINYTFATPGTKTLYAWAKDGADNVSTSLSASTTVTLADATPPTVTAFSIPGTFNSLTVPITAFTATDDVGVTGYMITESATTPMASAAGWSGTPLSSYVFASAGAKTLYAWAKDTAGNVSTALSAIVTVTTGGPVPDLSVWVGKWFKLTEKNTGFVAGSSGGSLTNEKLSLVAYVKFWRWDQANRVLQGDQYTKDGQTGQWMSEPLMLDFIAGSHLDFLCSSGVAGDVTMGFTARIQAKEGNEGLGSATFKTLGGYYIEENKQSGSGSGSSEYFVGGLSITGNLIPESKVPVPADVQLH